VPAKAVKGIWTKRRQSGGFTLVELLVVIAIIGVLATLVLLQLGSARSKSRDTQRIAAVSQSRSAVEQYFEDNGNKYPVSADWATLCSTLKTAGYMSSCPTLAGMSYGYNPSTSPTKFQVAAELENRVSALDADADINATVSGWTNGVNGATEAAAGGSCSTATDCYYDQGTD